MKAVYVCYDTTTITTIDMAQSARAGVHVVFFLFLGLGAFIVYLDI